VDGARRHVNTRPSFFSLIHLVLFVVVLLCVRMCAWCGVGCCVTGSFARAVSNSIRGALAFKLLEDPDTFDASATAR